MPLAVETKDFLATWAESRFGDGPFTPSLKDKQELVAETGLDKRQVENAKLALQHNLGLGGAAVVAMYRKMEQ